MDKTEFEPVLWNDLCSEYDSQPLMRHLQSRGPRSAGLQQVLDAWIADEINHYFGFARLYALIYGSPLADIQRRLASRASDFKEIGRWLEDETSLCILLAFDEIATVRAYVDDYGFYDAFGIAQLSTWIRHVAQDEARHFSNFVELVARSEAFSAAECDRVIDEIHAYDLAACDYSGTFVLDHSGPQFTPVFLDGCARTLKQAIRTKAHAQSNRSSSSRLSS